jgi:hypothetical protein
MVSSRACAYVIVNIVKKILVQHMHQIYFQQQQNLSGEQVKTKLKLINYRQPGMSKAFAQLAVQQFQAFKVFRGRVY